MSVFSNDEGIFQVRADKARRRRQEILDYLANDYRSIASILQLYYPPAILSRAAWHSWQLSSSRKTDEAALATARIFPVLLQSVFISRFYENTTGYSSRQEIRDRDWDRLRNLVDDASRRLMRLCECEALIALDEKTIDRSHFFSYRDALFDQLFGKPVDKEDLEKARVLFVSLFSGDEELAQTVFHCDHKVLMEELFKICQLAVSGIADLVERTRAVNDEIKARVDDLMKSESGLSRQDASSRVVQEGGYKAVLEDLRRKGDGYELFSAEYNSLLSSKTLSVLSATASSQSDVLVDGRLCATLHPFIRFADRFYTFIGPVFATSIVYALRLALQSVAAVSGFGDKLDKLFDTFILPLLRMDDVEDVYTYRGFKTDVVLLASTRHINPLRFAQTWSARVERRAAGEARKALPGHVLLQVDPDSLSCFEKKGENLWRISLACLASTSSSEALTESFYRSLFGPDSADEPEVELYDEVLAEEDLVEDVPTPVDDEAPSPLFPEDEGEFDRQDDDEKARIIESYYDRQIDDVLPADEPVRRNPDIDADAYELPEDLVNQPIVEELEALDEDEFAPEEVDSVDDDEDEAYLLDDEEETEDGEPDYSFTDDDIGPDAGLVDDVDDWEYSNETPDQGEDVCYRPKDDPDQLLLFDDEGNVAQNLPDDETVDADRLEDDTSDLEKEDGVDSSLSDIALQELGDDESDDLLKEDDDDGPLPVMDEVVQASAEEESDSDDSEPEYPDSDDDDEDGITPAEAEKEEALLESGRSEESLEAEDELDELARSCDSMDGGDDEDLMVDSEPDYGPETSYSTEDEDESEVSHAAEGMTDYSVPPSLVRIIDRLDGPADELVRFVKDLDENTLRAFDEALRRTVTASLSENRDKMLVVPSACISFVVTPSNRLDALRKMEVRNNAGSQMLARDRNSWSFFLLCYDSSEKLNFAWGEKISEKTFSASDWKIVRVQAQELKKTL